MKYTCILVFNYTTFVIEMAHMNKLLVSSD